MKVMISGYYGFGNLGDEAILSVLVRELRQRFPDMEIVVLSETPQETSRKHEVRAINRWNIWNIRRELKNTSAFISGGGGLIQDLTSRRSTLYYLGLISQARCRCPVFLIGQGIGPLRSSLVRAWAKRTLHEVDFAMVRDEPSEEILHSWGIPQERLALGGDLALLLWPECRSLHKAPDRISSHWAVCIKGGLSKMLKEKLILELDALSEQGRVAFLVLYPKEDLREAEELAGRMRHTPLVLTPASYEEALMSLRGAKAIVGMRLHALIFSLLMIRPFLAISDDPKIEAFLEQVEGAGGPKVPCWKPEELQSLKLREALVQLASDSYERAGAHLLRAGEALYHQTHQALSLAFHKLSRVLKGRELLYKA